MRFFIACMANYASGGPELLHQLSACLTNKGIENYMLYYNADPAVSPTPDSYVKYQAKYVTSFVDDEESVLICPEVLIHTISICTRGITIIWWLSVDNYIRSYRSMIDQSGKVDIFDIQGRANVLYFVQSRYAYGFVERSFLPDVKELFYLTDYINDEIVQTGETYREQFTKENIVLYNPRKGAQNLEQIMAKCRGDIRWIPLSGLTPVQMALLMCRAKVYIDFGNHPGKDRIPREAAVCGCCIITNREGSAAYKEDVGIPEEYKFTNMQDHEHILEAIYDMMDNYSHIVGEYRVYVTSIMNEKKQFEKEVGDMLEIVGERCIKRRMHWERQRYDGIAQSMQKTASKIYALYEGFQKTCAGGGEGDKAVRELLDVEYLLSVLRETNYMVIKDILADDN